MSVMRRPISLKVYSITLSLLVLMVIVTALSARNLRSLNNEVAALSRYYIPLDQQAGSIETLVRQQVVHLERILLLLQAPRRDKAAIETLVKNHFETIPKSPATKLRPTYNVPEQPGTLYAIASDKEASGTSVGVYSKMPAREQTVYHRHDE